jgi:hypothetical protein
MAVGPDDIAYRLVEVEVIPGSFMAAGNGRAPGET